MVYITAVKVSGAGNRPEHITYVWWLQSPQGTSGSESTAAMVKWINDGNSVQVAGPAGPVDVHVVNPAGRPAYLRTVADQTRADNLLALPRL